MIDEVSLNPLALVQLQRYEVVENGNSIPARPTIPPAPSHTGRYQRRRAAALLAGVLLCLGCIPAYTRSLSIGDISATSAQAHST